MQALLISRDLSWLLCSAVQYRIGPPFPGARGSEIEASRRKARWMVARDGTGRQPQRSEGRQAAQGSQGNASKAAGAVRCGEVKSAGFDGIRWRRLFTSKSASWPQKSRPWPVSDVLRSWSVQASAWSSQTTFFDHTPSALLHTLPPQPTFPSAPHLQILHLRRHTRNCFFPSPYDRERATSRSLLPI